MGKALIRLMVFAVAVSAWVQESHAELVIGVYTGASHTTPGFLRFTHAATGTGFEFSDVEWEGRSLRRPIYYGGRIGYLPWNRGRFQLGPEFEFIHAKAYVKPDQEVQVTGRFLGQEVAGFLPVDALIESFNISHGLNLVLGSLVAQYGVLPTAGRPMGRLRLSARVGGGVNISHFETRLRNLPYHEQYAYGGPVMQLAGGAHVPLWGPLGAMGEYKYTAVTPEGPINGGRVEARTDTHHIVGGIVLSW
jgi:hypothetical protein